MKPLKNDITRLKELLKNIPKSPGCYLMLDDKDRILYVGKSKNLFNRVRSYFQSQERHSPRISLMIRQIIDINFIITDNESEALTLEDNLIKSNQPYFNILLKDDKKYPYVCITWSEEYPRIFITRNRRERQNGDKYYGPYVDVNLLRKTIFLIKRVFPLRQRYIPLYKDRTCLNYSIKRCPGVCQEKISSEEYKKTLLKIEMIFQGRSKELVSLLKDKMIKYSDSLQYEYASRVRDQLKGLKHIGESQKITIPDSSASRDILHLVSDKQISSIQLFQMRAGKLVARLGYISKVNDLSNNNILQLIIEDHYSKIDSVEIPKEILTGYSLPKVDYLSDWLSDLKGSKVNIYTPKRGSKYELVELVKKNAYYELQKIISGREKNISSMEELANLLDLDSLPRRIEGYDISHLQGTNPVGSQVVFIDGLPAKQHYRKYNIKNKKLTIGHSDDFLSLAEVIRRRFKKWSRYKSRGGNIQNIKIHSDSVLRTDDLNDWPDLILIDGGKGQLSTVYKVLDELNLTEELSICSLAKAKEEVYLPFSKEPLDCDLNDLSVNLLRQVRDESHRFALSFHRQKRSKYMTSSNLLNIPGIGTKRIKELLHHFHSVEAIKLATVEEINKVPGFGKSISKVIWDYFNQI